MYPQAMPVHPFILIAVVRKIRIISSQRPDFYMNERKSLIIEGSAGYGGIIKNMGDFM